MESESKQAERASSFHVLSVGGQGKVRAVQIKPGSSLLKSIWIQKRVFPLYMM